MVQIDVIWYTMSSLQDGMLIMQADEPLSSIYGQALKVYLGKSIDKKRTWNYIECSTFQYRHSFLLCILKARCERWNYFQAWPNNLFRIKDFIFYIKPECGYIFHNVHISWVPSGTLYTWNSNKIKKQIQPCSCFKK